MNGRLEQTVRNVCNLYITFLIHIEMPAFCQISSSRFLMHWISYLGWLYTLSVFTSSLESYSLPILNQIHSWNNFLCVCVFFAKMCACESSFAHPRKSLHLYFFFHLKDKLRKVCLWTPSRKMKNDILLNFLPCYKKGKIYKKATSTMHCALTCKRPGGFIASKVIHGPWSNLSMQTCCIICVINLACKKKDAKIDCCTNFQSNYTRKGDSWSALICPCRQVTSFVSAMNFLLLFEIRRITWAV